MSKKAIITEKSLHLFAEYGYDGVSTIKIALESGVSEGLIFKHFKNKLGLLHAVMQIGAEKLEQYAREIENGSNPEEIIQAMLELPFHIDKDDYPYWKLIYTIKWQTDHYDNSIITPLRDALEKAFKQLKYSNPKIETDLIITYMDGFATSLLLKQNQVNKKELLQTLRKKYNWILKK